MTTSIDQLKSASDQFEKGKELSDEENAMIGILGLNLTVEQTYGPKLAPKIAKPISEETSHYFDS